MIFTVSYFVYSINYLVCLARTNWGEVTMHGFTITTLVLGIYSLSGCYLLHTQATERKIE